MNVLAWLVVGFLAGGLARVATGSEKKGCLGTIVIGILGALIGGGLWRFATGSDTDAFSEFQRSSVLVAFVGASALLLVLQVLGADKGRRKSSRGRWS
jgi:uncharacterized membrane protein YeaQ/YmgE (transglycosylase-associated protein family)